MAQDGTTLREADRLAALLAEHDLVALLRVDFHHHEQRAHFLSEVSLASGDGVEHYKAAQRVARLFPLTDPAVQLAGHVPHRAVAQLVARGLTSAHHVAEIPERTFVVEHADAFGGDEHLAREVHRRAVQVRAAVRHAAANMRDIGSPYFKSMLGTSLDSQLTEYVEAIPGYQELFGGLNYLTCEECASIFGPAAYFFDIMRITDRYITKECPTIPPEYTLRARRPDLFSLPLTCANTNNPIPYVVLVNDILKQRLGGSAVRALATAVFPFDLPFNEPRTRLAMTLARIGTPFATAASALLARAPDAPLFETIALAGAALGLSPESIRFVTTARTSDAEIAAEYGYLTLAAHLPAGGPGSVTIVAQETTATGGDGKLGDLLAVGQQLSVTISGQIQVRTVAKRVDAATVEVDVAWATGGADLPYTIYPLDDLTTVRTFRSRAGVGSYDDLIALFTQSLSAEERRTLGASLWINATGESLPDLAVSSDTGGDAANPVSRIVGLSPKRLDRLSRLLRLARATGLPIDLLDWLIVRQAATLADAEITPALLIRLASLQRLATTTGLGLVDVAAFVYELKTLGRQSASALADLFDLIFNAAAVRRGTDPYTSPSPIPFDPARPLAWRIDAGPDWKATAGSAVAATATTITLAQDASSESGAYVGLAVTIASGAANGANGVVREYDGALRVATLYTAWTTVPEAGASYVVGAVAGVTDRLAAALRVRAADLQALGAYLAGRSDAILPLTLENLTALWQLATLAARYRLTVDGYLTLRRLLELSPKPAKGDAALAALAAVADAAGWLTRSKLTVYELDYVLTATRSRYLRLTYDPATLPAGVAGIARNGVATLLTAQTLVQAGLTPDDAAKVVEGLQTAGFVDGRGVVLPARTPFDTAAARFPIPTSDFVSGPVDAEQAQAVVEELRRQQPPYLAKVSEDQSQLAWEYRAGATLDGLFAGLTDADAGRALVGAVLDNLAARVVFAEFAGFAPVEAAGSFVSGDIGAAQSQAVYAALVALKPPVLLEPGGKSGVAYLSADYTAETKLPGLFESAATGQNAAVKAYTGATRVAAIDGTWQTTPDAFSTYVVRQTLNAGTARDGTTTTIQLDVSASAADGAYVGREVALVSGLGAGQRRTVSDYVGATRTATVGAEWQTVPTTESGYTVQQTVAQGAARAGTSDSITLAETASPDDGAYDGCEIALVADPDAARKVAEVRAVLAATQARVATIRDTVDAARTAQSGYVAQGLASLLAIPRARLLPLLPFANGRFLLDDDLAGLLTPPTDGTVPASVRTLADGLVRAILAASRLGLDDDVLRGVARRPDYYGIGQVDAPTFASLRALAAIPTFVSAVGADGAGLVGYLDVWTSIVKVSGKRAALASLSGWEPSQVEAIGTYLTAAQIDWPGIETFPGLLRLRAPFAALDGLSADASFLVRVADAARLPGLDGGAGDDAIWSAYATAADAALALLSARYGEVEGPAMADELARDVASATRDALLGYAIVTLGKTIPGLQTPADLFSYLLIDVEMAGCDTTSPIAQGITAVQLYMQRVRMGLEPGADTTKIRESWWDWISTYRLWEANRKVFLYPENYINPTLRRTASPEFTNLIDELLQGSPTDENVARAMTNYFDAFEQIATLAHVGAYKLEDDPREGGQLDQRSYVIARTNTTPYVYYVRDFTRSLLADTKQANSPTAESIVWEPWRKIDATINSPDVTPVFAFDRVFLFWNEIEPMKSTRVTTSSGNTDAQTKTESSWQATLRYTFRGSTGTWISSQELEEPLAIRAMPNEYAPARNDLVTAAYSARQAYWTRPYAQQIPRGIPATGTLAFAVGSKEATGTGTVVERQVQPGDTIWVGGEARTVDSVDQATQRIVVSEQFTVSGQGAPFKVVPRDRHTVSFAPFAGPGKVRVVKGFPQVRGDADTRFERDFAVGDGIQAGGETRTVVAIFDDSNLIVDRDWKASSSLTGDGMVTIFPRIYNVSGDNNAHFDTQVQKGDTIVADGMSRTVAEVEDANSLLITEPFAVESSKTVPYTIDRTFAYTAIPRTRGDERLMVFYGPNLDVKTALPRPDDDGHEDNPGDDPFIASRNQFNAGLYSALTLARVVNNTLPGSTGDVTGQSTLLLGETLDQQTVRLFAPGALIAATNTTPPLRAALDRENSVLFVREEKRPLVALYWGNSTPSATQNQASFGTANDRPLAYHVGGQSSLYGYGNQIGWYLFNAASQAFWIARDDLKARTSAPSTFVRPFWQPTANSDLMVEFGPYTTSAAPLADAKYRFTRLSTSVVPGLKARLLAGGFDLLLSLGSQSLPEPPFSQFYEIPSTGTPPPAVDANHLPPTIMDFNGAYGPYFWEIFFHAPLLVAQQLEANQDFASARRWYEYIYNPHAQPTAGDEGESRYWRFRPFREGMTLPGLKDVLQNPFEITAYNDDPFNPDAIARLRISAYAKTTVLKYVDNLILWGDALFRQDTRESIAQATNLYVLASQLLGPRPEVVGELPPRAPQSFDDIAAHYPDEIPQFLIELENSALVPLSGEGRRFSDAPINDINAYFCVPENAELTAYWDRVEDRLFKIRHCLNIDGVERTLALFAPPIDVRALLAAYGAGGAAAGAGVLAGGPVPNFRFSYLVAYAKSIAENVIRLGASLLTALERKDAEALATLQITQEARILDLTTAIRKQQVDLVDQQRVAIQAARDGADKRSTYYQSLIDAGYIAAEIAQITFLMGGMVSQGISTVLKSASALGFAVPQVGAPTAMTYGGQQVGNSLKEAADALDTFALFLGTGAQVLGISAEQARRVEEWTLQKALADFDVKQFDAQLIANTTEKAIAQQELTSAQVQVQQNAALGEFYRTKFTNEDLYSWMASRLSTTYFQTYTLALDFARMAQRALQYELRTDTTFVTSGNWNDLRRGLTAGESLMLSLNQLESTYVAGSSRAFEITKTISLASVDPLAFLTLIRTGEASFNFGEALFDADFPGHYRRRIKTLSVSIPALVGPYQNVHATLTQTANRVVLQPDVKAVRFLLGEDVAVPGNQIEHNVRVNQSIVVSLGQGDSGLFQVDLNDPLLLPFEQTGAVSSWKLSMPPATNPIDLASIPDVIFELRYTAYDGGTNFRDNVASLPQLQERKWSSTTQIARQNAGAWHIFMTGPVTDEQQRLTLRLAGLALPNVAQPVVAGFFLRLLVPDGTPTTSRHPYITLALADAEPVAFSPGPQGTFLAAFDQPVPLTAGALGATISFNLATGYTPAALLDNKRLSASVLQDIELVLFLSGSIQSRS